MKRLTVLFLILASLGGCSCSSRPPAEERETQDAHDARAPAATNTTAPPGTLPADIVLQQEYAGTLAQASSTLHAYLRLLGARQFPQADTFWTGGRPPADPGDYAVRALEDMQAIRIRNDPPKALDRESPPQSIEIPVQLRVTLASGNLRTVAGYYRLRRKVDGTGWEITSASLQPVLE